MRVSIKSIGLEHELVTLSSESAEVAAVVSRTERYSITPTTFDERIFENTIDNLWFIDKYLCETESATRFGINISSSQIMPSIASDGIKILDESSSAASTVKSVSYRPEEAKKILLASLEVELLHKAILYLMESNIKTVLVDIFARINGGPSNGAIKIKDGKLETHTVVLYKNPIIDTVDPTEATSVASAEAANATATNHVQIFVIDPSNFLFSSHVSNLNVQKTQIVSRASTDTLASDINASSGTSAVATATFLSEYNINTIHKGLQIYKPTGSVGPRQDQYRDCLMLQ